MGHALDAAATATPDGNYSRTGSVLATRREEFGINEMDVLDCIPTATTDPRLPEMTSANIAAVCITDLPEASKRAVAGSSVLTRALHSMST